MIKKKKKIVKKARKPVKSTAKKPIKRKVKTPESTLQKIGEVTHYFQHVNAAAVKLLKGGLRIGESIYLKGHTTDFKEKVKSIQLDNKPIQEGKKGQEIGLFVKNRVRIGDSVYRI